MSKYIVNTELKITKIYSLQYELELDHCPTEDDLDGYIPEDEEFFSESRSEEIISVEKL